MATLNSPLSAQESPYVSRVLEYKPAPGQFINTTIGSPYAAESLIGGLSGIVSLGAWGGYIVLGFDHPIINDANNPYGVDFAVFGNATTSSSEPAAVYVMADDNNNGLADDTWYLLAGSDYYFSNSQVAYEVTYQNPGTDSLVDIPWMDNKGNSGVIEHNSYHTQAYFPKADSFPDINQEAYKLEGLLIQPRINLQNESFVTTNHYPFGFADNTPRNLSNSSLNPNNPYTDALEGMGGDSFDISWAVDAEGGPVTLERIDFIKIQTAVNASAGWLGEISTELMGVLDIAPDITLNGETRRLVLEPFSEPLRVNESENCQYWFFDKGIPQTGALVDFWVADENLLDVDQFGSLTPKKAGETWLFAALQNDNSIKDSLLVVIQNPVSSPDEQANQLVLFPNPVKTQLFVAGSQLIAVRMVTNALGQVFPLPVRAANSYDVSDLSPGVYFITFQIADQVITRKIVKN